VCSSIGKSQGRYGLGIISCLFKHIDKRLKSVVPLHLFGRELWSDKKPSLVSTNGRHLSLIFVEQI